MTTTKTTKVPARTGASVGAIKLLTDDHKEVHALDQKYMTLATTDAKGANSTKDDGPGRDRQSVERLQGCSPRDWRLAHVAHQMRDAVGSSL